MTGSEYGFPPEGTVPTWRDVRWHELKTGLSLWRHWRQFYGVARSLKLCWMCAEWSVELRWDYDRTVAANAQ